MVRGREWVISGGELRKPRVVKERLVWGGGEGMGEEWSQPGSREQGAAGTQPGWTEGRAVWSPPGLTREEYERQGEPLIFLSGKMTQ